MAQVYKTFTIEDLNNKANTPTNETQNQKVSQILNSFVTLFKAKHL